MGVRTSGEEWEPVLGRKEGPASEGASREDLS